MGNSRRCPRPVLATNICFPASDSCLKRPVPGTYVLRQNRILGPRLKVDVSHRCGLQLGKDLRSIDVLTTRSILSKDQAGGWNASYSTGA